VSAIDHAMDHLAGELGRAPSPDDRRVAADVLSSAVGAFDALAGGDVERAAASAVNVGLALIPTDVPKDLRLAIGVLAEMAIGLLARDRRVVEVVVEPDAEASVEIVDLVAGV